MAERLSSEEARNVKLSKNPVRRLGQLARYAEAFRPHNATFGRFDPITGVFTRNRLVELAEARESADAFAARVKSTRDHIETAATSIERDHEANQAVFRKLADRDRFDQTGVPGTEVQDTLFEIEGDK